MNCPQCGSAAEANMKFCTDCGAKIEPIQETAASVEVPEQSAPNTTLPNDTSSAESSGTDSKVKQITTDYFSFIWESIKTPGATARSLDSSSMLPGLITLIILTVLMPLFDYIRALIYRTPDLNLGAMGDFGDLAEMFGLSQYYSVSFGYDFLRPLIITAVSIALTITVIFVTANLLKASLSFMDVVSRFGAIMVVPTAVLLLGGLLSWLGVNLLVSFIHSFGMLGVAAAIIFTIHSFTANEKRLDSYYVGGIVLVVSYLLYSVVKMIFA